MSIDLDDMTPIERLKWRFEEIVAGARSEIVAAYLKEEQDEDEEEQRHGKPAYFDEITKAIKAFEDEEATARAEKITPRRAKIKEMSAKLRAKGDWEALDLLNSLEGEA